MLFGFVIFSKPLIAQESEIQAFSDIVEQIAENSDEELDYTSLYETLIQYYNDPIDLNLTNAEQLDRLMFLTFYQARSIIKYRDKFNGFKSIYELQFVDGIDQQTLKFLLNFVTVMSNLPSQPADLKRWVKHGKHVVFVRTQFTVQPKAGYQEVPDSILLMNPDKNRYLGSPYKLYTRYRYNYKDKLYWGITAEKDAGEEFFRGSQPYGFDYYSAHLQVNQLGPVKTAILGDYQVEFGQGLTLWSGMSFGKSTNPINIIKKGRGIARYGSTNESDFLRGQAASFSLGKFTITEFVSHKLLDARMESDSSYEEEEEYVTNFLNTGYHRTPSEISVKNNVKQTIYGGHIAYKGEWLLLGITTAAMHLSKPLTHSGALYNMFEFAGTNMMNMGIHYTAYKGNFSFFGESSMSNNLGYASLNAVNFTPAPEVNLSILHRYFGNDYQSIYAAPFSESNKAFNESGLYVGAVIYPMKRVRLDLYADMWKYPWLKYGVSAPSMGREYFAQLNYSPTRYVDMFARIKYETKQRNNSATEFGVHDLSSYSTRKIRYHISMNPGSGFSLKTRLEWVHYRFDDGDAEEGFLIYQDVAYRFYRIPLQLTARIGIHNTDTYNARLYAWEPDVLYAFSVPAYYDKGTRLIFLVKYSISDNLDFWFRIANSFYYNKTTISSGLDEISGKNRTDINIQLRYNF